MSRFDEMALRADILALAELERARKARFAYEAHLEREADRAVYDHSFDSDPYGMVHERSRYP
jgi:hypothetical protein